ncbi:MAG: hypothetical protein L3J76_03220, partial [Candidatus Hydrothermae bacterium]|nr:hypothetical protein [Candidatus Hydrothermae bacterium]
GLNPFMTVDSAGGVHVVWQSADDVLAYSYRDPGGKWLQEEVARSPRAWAVIADQNVEVVGGVVWVSAVIATDTGRGWGWGLWRRMGPGQWERVETPLASRHLASVRVVPVGDLWFVTYMIWEERIGGWRHRLLWGFWREGGWVEAGTLAVYVDREPVLFPPACTMGACWGVWTVDEGAGLDQQYEVWIREIRR